MEDNDTMREIEISISVRSEKSDNFYLGFGTYFNPEKDVSIESAIEEEIEYGTMDEDYGELLSEFEEDVCKAVELSKQENIPIHDALVEMFGHILFSYYLGEDRENEVVFDSAVGEDRVYKLLGDTAGWYL